MGDEIFLDVPQDKDFILKFDGFSEQESYNPRQLAKEFGYENAALLEEAADEMKLNQETRSRKQLHLICPAQCFGIHDAHDTRQLLWAEVIHSEALLTRKGFHVPSHAFELCHQL